MNRRLFVTIPIVALAIFVLAQRFLDSKGAEPRNAVQPDRVVLLFGDELAASASSAFAKAEAEKPDRSTFDQTKVGETSTAAAARIEAALATAAPVNNKAPSAAGPNYVIVSLGTHDLEARTPLDETINALEAIFTKAQAKGALVSYLAITPPAEVGDNWKMAIEDVCRRNAVLVIPPGAAPVAERVAKELSPYL